MCLLNIHQFTKHLNAIKLTSTFLEIFFFVFFTLRETGFFFVFLEDVDFFFIFLTEGTIMFSIDIGRIFAVFLDTGIYIIHVLKYTHTTFTSTKN